MSAVTTTVLKDLCTEWEILLFEVPLESKNITDYNSSGFIQIKQVT